MDKLLVFIIIIIHAVGHQLLLGMYNKINKNTQDRQQVVSPEIGWAEEAVPQLLEVYTSTPNYNFSRWSHEIKGQVFNRMDFSGEYQYSQCPDNLATICYFILPRMKALDRETNKNEIAFSISKHLK